MRRLKIRSRPQYHNACRLPTLPVPTAPIPVRSQAFPPVADIAPVATFGAVPRRETCGTVIFLTSSMAWYGNGNVSLPEGAACLAIFRCADNDLTAPTVLSLYLAVASLESFRSNSGGDCSAVVERRLPALSISNASLPSHQFSTLVNPSAFNAARNHFISC